MSFMVACWWFYWPRGFSFLYHFELFRSPSSLDGFFNSFRRRWCLLLLFSSSFGCAFWFAVSLVPCILAKRSVLWLLRLHCRGGWIDLAILRCGEAVLHHPPLLLEREEFGEKKLVVVAVAIPIRAFFCCN